MEKDDDIPCPTTTAVSRVLITREMVVAIMSYLDLRSLTALAQASKALHQTLKGSDSLWEKFYWDIYSSVGVPSKKDGTVLPSSWRSSCQELAMKWKRWAGAKPVTKDVLDVVGQVILATPSLPTTPYFTCAGELGVVCFLDLHPEHPAIVYEHQSQSSTIFCLEAQPLLPCHDSIKYQALTGSAIGELREEVIDVQYQSSQVLFTHSFSSGIHHLAISLNGDLLAIGLADGGVNVWRRAITSQAGCSWRECAERSEEMVYWQAHRGEICGLAFMTTSLLVTGSSEDGHLKAFPVDDKGTTTTTTMPLRQSPSLLWSLALDGPDDVAISSTEIASHVPSGRVAVGTKTGRLIVCEAKTGQVTRKIPAHSLEVWCLRMNAQVVVSCSRDKTLAAHSLSTGECLWRNEVGYCTRLCFTADQVLTITLDARIISLSFPPDGQDEHHNKESGIKTQVQEGPPIISP